MSEPQAPDRNLALEVVRVTEAAALAGARWLGRGDKNAADGAAVDAMRLLLSTVQMPAGIPVGTLAIGKAGAKNAALLAIAILANSRPELREKLKAFRKKQADAVLKETLP